MNKKLIAPIVTAAAMLATSIGSTFALFSSKASSRIDIEAGKVQVDLANTLDWAVSHYEKGEEAFDAVAAAEGSEFDALFENGNTAVISTSEVESAIELDRFTPLDQIAVNMKATNSSNINIKWRYYLELSGDVIPALDIKVDDQDYSTTETYAKVYGLWSDAVEPSEVELLDLDVVVTFPDHGEDDNQYQEKTGLIKFGIEAVQGNAAVENPHDTTYGFYDSKLVDEGLETEHWVHTLSSASEFKNMVLPNEAAQALDDKAGLYSEKTVYVLENDISFDSKTPWEAMEITKDEWQNFVFTGTLTGGDEVKKLSDSIISSEECESLTTKKFVGALFSKNETATISNLEISNFVVEQGATALESSGILFGGNEPGSTETQHVYDLVVKDVTIDETCSITGAKNIGAFMGNVRYFKSLHVENYLNYANVTSTGYGASGFVGTATGLQEALFENSTNYGTISGNEGRAAGFIGAISGIGTGSKQTLPGAFKFVNCASNGTLNDYPTKAMQGGGYFVGLQSSGDSAAYSAECANCTIGGTLRTNINAGGNFTLAYERGAEWIVNKSDMDTLVISNVIVKMGLSGDYSTHRLSLDNGELEVDHYTLTIRMDCYDAKADFDTKTFYSTDGGGKILNIISSQSYATKEDLEANGKMVSRIGYFMPTKDDVTIEKGDVSRYANKTAHRFQEFVLDESKRGTEGFNQVLSEDADGGLRYIAMNNTVDEYDRFTVFTRMGTYMHYVVSAFDSNGAMIGLGEWTYGIFHIDDDHCNSVLPIGATSYIFYKNYEW